MTALRVDKGTLERRLSGSMKLVEVTCALAGLHDLDQILKSVATGACTALECERASLYLYDEERREIYTRVVTELEIAEIRSSIDHGITGWVARERKVANVPQPQIDERWNSEFDKKTGFHTRNILAVPLISVHDNRLIGVLQLLNKAGGSFDSFDEQLLQSFGIHAASALERAELLEKARRSQELEVSAQIGRRIQISFLPRQLPEVPGYEIAAWWEPAENVGGDYYDLLTLPDGRLGLVMADVSGHGVGPSLIMASVRAMLRVLARTSSDPIQIVHRLCELIEPDLQDGRFITFLMVALDTKTHEVVFANAGHGPALHFHRSTQKFEHLESSGMPLGFCETFDENPAGTLKLEPGDILLLATDGTIELRNEDDKMFGGQRLEQLILDNQNQPATFICDRIRNAVTNFHPKEHPPDDVTLLLLERKVLPNASPLEAQLSIRS